MVGCYPSGNVCDRAYGATSKKLSHPIYNIPWWYITENKLIIQTTTIIPWDSESV